MPRLMFQCFDYDIGWREPQVLASLHGNRILLNPKRAVARVPFARNAAGVGSGWRLLHQQDAIQFDMPLANRQLIDPQLELVALQL